MSILIGWLLIGLAIALFLIGVIASLWRRSDVQPRTGTRVMLILLRLAIGWHFLIEGMDKLHQPNWTSAGYLRESTGPLSPQFRELAGDSLLDMVTIEFDFSNAPSLSPRLNEEWHDYAQAVIAYYRLEGEQSQAVDKALDQVTKETINLLLKRKKLVEKPSAYPPTLKVELTMPQRIDEYKVLVDKAADFEKDWLPQYGSEIHEKWKTARANASKWRADMQKDLVLINKEMKRSMRQELLDIALEKTTEEDARKTTREAVKKLRRQADTDLNGAYAAVITARLKKGKTYLIKMESADMDCYLRLEDGSGVQLGENSSGSRKVGIEYKVPAENTAKEDVAAVATNLGLLATGQQDDLLTALATFLDTTHRADESYRIVAGSYSLEVGSFKLDVVEIIPPPKAVGPGPVLLTPVLDTKRTLKKDDKDKDPGRKGVSSADWEAVDKIKDKLGEKITEEYRKAFDTAEKNGKLGSDPLVTQVRENLITRRKQGQPSLDPLPFVVTRPWKQWTLLNWSDHFVKYGITAVGLMLLLGLLTRTACVAGAGFLLMFFLAMPPIPGLPESPRAEGHYLYVNKNTIEMLALLVLATTSSGRWLGLDAALRFLCPSCWRRSQDAVKM